MIGRNRYWRGLFRKPQLKKNKRYKLVGIVMERNNMDAQDLQDKKKKKINIL